MMRPQPEELKLADGTLLTLHRAVSLTMTMEAKKNSRMIGDWLIAIQPDGRRIVALISNDNGKWTAKMIYDTLALNTISTADVPTLENLDYVLYNVDDKNEEEWYLNYYRCFKPYGMSFAGTGPIAIKLSQTAIHAPQHITWRNVQCELCEETFGVGYNQLYPMGTEEQSVSKLKSILAADHARNRRHDNLYELGS